MAVKAGSETEKQRGKSASSKVLTGLVVIAVTVIAARIALSPQASDRETPQPRPAEQQGGAEGSREELRILSDHLVMSEDFEKARVGRYSRSDAEAGWGGLAFAREGFDERDARIVENPQGIGNVLKVTIPEGVIGMALFFDLKFPDADEARLRYRVRFGEGFDFSKMGGKLPGLGATAPGEDRPPMHCDDPGQDQGFSARHMWARDGKMIQYLYFDGRDGRCGSGVPLRGGAAFLEAERWYEVEQYVQMNDPPRSNGIVRTWIDGELAAEARGLTLRTTADYGINRLVFSSYFGGSDESVWAHDRLETLYYDDFAVYVTAES
jgi:hypothetical protein